MADTTKMEVVDQLTQHGEANTPVVAMWVDSEDVTCTNGDILELRGISFQAGVGIVLAVAAPSDE
jgi:hypothetical protein